MEVMYSLKYSFTKNLDAFGRSLIKIKKSNGSSMEPCGIPISIRQSLDVLSFNLTYCQRLERYDLIKLSGRPLTPYFSSFCSKILWLTESKALAKSKNIAHVKYFLSIFLTECRINLLQQALCCKIFEIEIGDWLICHYSQNMITKYSRVKPLVGQERFGATRSLYIHINAC